ncbi:UNVERIFIED_CONTAM: hypothetical protein H355_008669 [Colinus virginianus]|nr:hypothetical protein H355_008669 [Colinus virginianus]
MFGLHSNAEIGYLSAQSESLFKNIQGQLNITEAMEQFSDALFAQKVPENWKKISFLSNKSLAPWVKDLLDRVKQLENWSSDLSLPASLWIAGLFNPMSFLTAIMQVSLLVR